MIYRPLFVRSEISRDLLVEPETRIRIFGTERERQISAGTLEGGPLDGDSAPTFNGKFDSGSPVERGPRLLANRAILVAFLNFATVPGHYIAGFWSS